MDGRLSSPTRSENDNYTLHRVNPALHSGTTHDCSDPSSRLILGLRRGDRKRYEVSDSPCLSSVIRQPEEKRLNHGIRLSRRAFRTFSIFLLKPGHCYGTDRIDRPERHTEKSQCPLDCGIVGVGKQLSSNPQRSFPCVRQDIPQVIRVLVRLATLECQRLEDDEPRYVHETNSDW